ncbi:hypothetical protein D3C87_1796530 [compost metagenome]
MLKPARLERAPNGIGDAVQRLLRIRDLALLEEGLGQFFGEHPRRMDGEERQESQCLPAREMQLRTIGSQKCKRPEHVDSQRGGSRRLRWRRQVLPEGLQGSRLQTSC